MTLDSKRPTAMSRRHPEGADDVDAPLGVPVPLSVTALPDGCVTEPARHVPGKSALVDPNACSPRRLIRRSPGLKGTPRGGVRGADALAFFS